MCYNIVAFSVINYGWDLSIFKKTLFYVVYLNILRKSKYKISENIVHQITPCVYFISRKIFEVASQQKFSTMHQLYKFMAIMARYQKKIPHPPSFHTQYAYVGPMLVEHHSNQQFLADIHMPLALDEYKNSLKIF